MPIDDFRSEIIQCDYDWLMAEPLKTFFSPALVRNLSGDIAKAWPSFPSQAFMRRAAAGLEELELMERARHITRNLAAHLPDEYAKAIGILIQSLGPEIEGDENLGIGMAPFYYLPHVFFVADYGINHFDLSMRAQYAITQRFSAEFSIRHFIAKDPEKTFAYFRKWVKDKNPHVRRLVSEGTRLRLPWARRVEWLDANPQRVIDLLETLKDDPSTMVRRSVANNLNDLTKVHTELAVNVCDTWWKVADGEVREKRRKLLHHALRSLIKSGNRHALGLIGVAQDLGIRISQVQLQPTRVKMGGKLSFSFALTSKRKEPQALLIDYAVHFVKANGSTKPKVFKLRKLTLAPQATENLQATLSFADMTTRRHYPGRHRIALRINGQDHPLAEFDLL